MTERRITGGFTPTGDQPFDDLAAVIDEMIAARLGSVAAEVAQVTGAGGGTDGTVTVRLWLDDDGDPDGGAQQRVARAAGVTLKRGDTVVVLPTGGGDYVVVCKLATSKADRAAVGPDDLLPKAVGPDAIDDKAVEGRHFSAGAVTTAAIADQAVTPAKLSQSYATPSSVGNQIDAAVSGLATTTYVDAQVATRYKEPQGEVVALRSWVNANFESSDSGGGTIAASKVIAKDDSNNSNDLQDVIENIAYALLCLNNAAGKKVRKPCSDHMAIVRNQP